MSKNGRPLCFCFFAPIPSLRDTIHHFSSIKAKHFGMLACIYMHACTWLFVFFFLFQSFFVTSPAIRHVLGKQITNRTFPEEVPQCVIVAAVRDSSPVVAV